ncbi:MAG: nucleotidyltransferase [Bryobacteraceae bacterium]
MTQAAANTRKKPLRVAWAQKIPEQEWRYYDRVIQTLNSASIPFALGGAFAVATYTGGWRNTKDLDLYVLPRHRKRVIELLGRLGMRDYYEQRPYDRYWIYRATSDGVIVDIMWAMANHRARVDQWWISGPQVKIRSHQVRVLPPEAILWDKIYIIQRERCDWPDAMNLLYFQGDTLDWNAVLKRVGEDTELLAGALSVFRWLSPGVAQRLPKWLWGSVNLPPLPVRLLHGRDKRHVSFLDRRPWYGPDRKKQVNG